MDSFVVAVKSDFINALSVRHSVALPDVALIVNDFLDMIVDQIKEGHKVELRGFGQFEPVDRAARKGRNPTNGAIMDIPACKGIKFKPGSQIKDALD